MPIYDTYSRRKQRAGGHSDVFQYDEIPHRLRGYVHNILDDAIGSDTETDGCYDIVTRTNPVWQDIRQILTREQAIKELVPGSKDPYQDVIKYLHSEQNVDEWLSLIEIAAWSIDNYVRIELGHDSFSISQLPDDAISELNQRFLNEGFGYQYQNGQIMRIDNLIVHQEVVKPALVLLADPIFTGPNEEFLAAHAHHRAGQHRDTIVDANNAFESTLKVICGERNWIYPPSATAPQLVKTVRQNGLLPDYLDKSFEQLAATLASGLPAVRNNEGGHGQGATPRETPGYIAAYALHLAAAKIVLLVEAYKAGK